MAILKIRRVVDLVRGTVEVDDDEVVATADKIVSERMKHVPLIDGTVWDESTVRDYEGVTE